MATAQSLKVVKSFLYRGSTREWSNRYHFTGGTVSGSTQWTTLSDAVTASEKACYVSTGIVNTIVATYGYDAGSDVPVFSKTYALTGTMAIAGGSCAPGDAAILVRYATATRTSKNHPLYLFNYHHGAIISSATTADTVFSTQLTNLGTFAAAWVAGFSDGTHTLVRCGPNGDVATGYLVNTKIHHRDFPNA